MKHKRTQHAQYTLILPTLCNDCIKTSYIFPLRSITIRYYFILSSTVFCS